MNYNLKILYFPDIRLRKKSKPIESVTDSLKKLAHDMLDIMQKEGGIGLAAPQVNRHVRLIVVNVDKPMILFNPEIIEREGENSSEEGCLSVPGFSGEVTRSNKIKVKYIDIDGNSKELDTDGLTAICIQHEVDHLDGKLFIDHIASLKS